MTQNWDRLADAVLAEIDTRSASRRRWRLTATTLIVVLGVCFFALRPSPPPVYDTPAFAVQFEDGTQLVLFDLESADE